MAELILNPATMVRGGNYKWKHQADQLVYLGKKGSWHQFKKIGDPRDVWCEVQDDELSMMMEIPKE